MRCPKCNAIFDEGVFYCGYCGTPLVEDTPAAGKGLKMGDANAINGGVHMNDSHNVTNSDQRVFNITQQERQKTEAEILQESKIQFMALCRQVYADGKLEAHEKAMLEMKRIELNLDERTATQLIESARRSVSSRMTALTVKDSVTMKLITKLVLENRVSLVKAQLPRLEAMARMYQVDEVLYKYNLLLAALNPEKLIKLYEQQPTDEYWQTFWVCLAYLKKNDVEKFEEASLKLNLYPHYSENNDLILQAISISHDFGAESDTVKEVMSIVDENLCSPELKMVIYALYLVLVPEKAEEVGADQKSCEFLMENIINIESPEEKAARVAKAKAEAEAKARAAAEEAARLKAEQEAKARAAAEEAARLRAEQEAKARAAAEEAARLKAEQEAKARAAAEEIARLKAEQEAKARAAAEEAARLKAELEAKVRAAEEEAARFKAEREALLRKQITYSVFIKKVENQMLAMMTARGALGWSSADSRANFAHLPFLAKKTDNHAEARALVDKLSKGGMKVSLEAVNGMGEKVDAYETPGAKTKGHK